MATTEEPQTFDIPLKPKSQSKQITDHIPYEEVKDQPPAEQVDLDQKLFADQYDDYAAQPNDPAYQEQASDSDSEQLHPLEAEFNRLKLNPIQGIEILSEFFTAKTKWILQVCPWTAECPYRGGMFRVHLLWSEKSKFPECRFKTKIYHPQVSEDGLALFWSEELTKVDSVAQLVELVLRFVEEPSEDERFHVRGGIGFELMHDYEYFAEVARQWTREYAQ